MRQLILVVSILVVACSGTPEKNQDLPDVAREAGDALVITSSDFPNSSIRFPTIPFEDSHLRFAFHGCPGLPFVVGFLVEDCRVDLDEVTKRVITEAQARLEVSIECRGSVVWVSSAPLIADPDATGANWILTTLTAGQCYFYQSPKFLPSYETDYVAHVRITFSGNPHPLPESPFRLRLLMYHHCLGSKSG